MVVQTVIVIDDTDEFQPILSTTVGNRVKLRSRSSQKRSPDGKKLIQSPIVETPSAKKKWPHKGDKESTPLCKELKAESNRAVSQSKRRRQQHESTVGKKSVSPSEEPKLDPDKFSRVSEVKRKRQKTTVSTDRVDEAPPLSSDSSEEKTDLDDGTDGFAPVVKRKAEMGTSISSFCGKPVPLSQAKKRWPYRFQTTETSTPRCSEHYEEAMVDGVKYKIGDCVRVNAEGSTDYLGKIVELFSTVNKECWFRIRWYFRLGDTSIGSNTVGSGIEFDPKRIFASTEEDDNPLGCIFEKKVIVQISPLTNFNKKTKFVPACDYYYDMGYQLDLSTYHKLTEVKDTNSEEICSDKNVKRDLSLLDLYSGCGGMSTGLCMGTALAGFNLVTRWALDLNEHACASLKYNHPETEVRNEDAESFLFLLKEWENLCKKYEKGAPVAEDDDGDEDDDDDELAEKRKENIYEVEKIVGVRFCGRGTPLTGVLQFKVHWKGYSSAEDSWESAENLSCEKLIAEFVLEGKKKHLLPLPGEVDMICGGPPCQGASGFNRFRNEKAPLECPRNRQMIIYMNIVEHLKPRFVLMENVVDILRFSNGILGRYALSRLVHMHYQAKLGLMVAGCYGLPQFRMRVFLWGAAPSENLPSFPLPTHNVVYRGTIPSEFSRNAVGEFTRDSDELKSALCLEDAFSDLPPVTNSETRCEMPYRKEPRTEFQRYIRSTKDVFYGGGGKLGGNAILFDHRPLQLNEDDIQRVCRIPKRKGANFRDLGGLRVNEENVIELDPNVEREYLPSGKPLVPDYAISFIKGKSLKPFGRLWWDETVPTVVTRAEPHNQRILHPTQDRVLSIRENARLQGFPDWYKLFGPIRERYVQVGNAVAVPVARALGYSLGCALERERGHPDATIKLPSSFPYSH